MPMLWRRIAWFASFAIAVALALWMRSLNFGWLATLSTAAVTYVILPFCHFSNLRGIRTRSHPFESTASPTR